MLRLQLRKPVEQCLTTIPKNLHRGHFQKPLGGYQFRVRGLPLEGLPLL